MLLETIRHVRIDDELFAQNPVDSEHIMQIVRPERSKMRELFNVSDIFK